MKKIIKKIIFFILTIEARLVLLRYRPKIIAVTGTVGKTATKDAIYSAMSSTFHVRKNNKSLNSEIGVPLTILGLESGWNNPAHWLRNILIGAVQVFYKQKYPKWLVLETGIDQPGDMKKTASWLKPHVAVVTAFAKVPSHVENFESPEAVMEEEGSLMNYLRKDGVLILNCDDEDVFKLKSKSENKVYTYGAEEGDITATNYSILYKGDVAAGISFKVNHSGNIIPIVVRGIVGEQFVYPILAALSVGVAINASVVDMATALSDMKFAPGRMNLLEGAKDTLLIDDTYNSSPIAVKRALEALGAIQTRGIKIAVLGDMLEIGHFSASEHKKVGSLVVKNKIDVLITVGVRSESTAQQAIEEGMCPQSQVYSFKFSEEAIETVQKFLEKNNIILVKGSQGIRMEKISRELLKDKEQAKNLLVRQESVWQNK